MPGNYVALSSLKNGQLADASGNVIPFRSVNVFLRATTTAPTVAPNPDGTGTPLTQPLTTTINGDVPGYVLSGFAIDFVDVVTGIRRQGEVLSANDPRPQGELGITTLTNNVILTTTPTDIGGMQTTVAVGVRPILVKFGAPTIAGASGATWTMRIQEGSTVLATTSGSAFANLAILPVYREVRLTPTSGSHTYKLNGSTSAGTAILGSTTDDRAYIHVLEI